MSLSVCIEGLNVYRLLGKVDVTAQEVVVDQQASSSAKSLNLDADRAHDSNLAQDLPDTLEPQTDLQDSDKEEKKPTKKRRWTIALL